MINFDRIIKGLLNKKKVLVMGVPRIVDNHHIFTYRTIEFKGGKPTEVVKCVGIDCGFTIHLCVN